MVSSEHGHLFVFDAVILEPSLDLALELLDHHCQLAVVGVETGRRSEVACRRLVDAEL